MPRHLLQGGREACCQARRVSSLGKRCCTGPWQRAAFHKSQARQQRGQEGQRKTAHGQTIGTQSFRTCSATSSAQALHHQDNAAARAARRHLYGVVQDSGEAEDAAPAPAAGKPHQGQSFKAICAGMHFLLWPLLFIGPSCLHMPGLFFIPVVVARIWP